MARTLDVYFDRDCVGKLVQDDDGQMQFQYATSWLDRPDAAPLSQSLPLRADRFSQRECRGFFGGILPEENTRAVIARILGISDRNDFALLERIGGECAGAITFLPGGTRMPEGRARYRMLDDAELARILRELPRRPLMAGEDGIRLSLAGAQDKIAVRVHSDGISVPQDSAPSTHILKPAINRFEGVVFNESFCMALAAQVGLPAARTAIRRVEDIDYLLVERFDRLVDEDGQIRRLHQEDFCQALGIRSDMKYQSEGGPSLEDCFALLRRTSSAAVVDLRALLDAVIFNVVIGNNDAHAKNFSLLYFPGGNTRVAPLYDLVSTVFYPGLSDRMAMKIGGERQASAVSPQKVERFARDVGLAVPPTLARVRAMAASVLEGLSKLEKPHGVSERLATVITERAEQILRRFPPRGRTS